MSDFIPMHWFDEIPAHEALRTATQAEINNCVDHLRELVQLGEEIVGMLDPEPGDGETSLLREWLTADLHNQRALLDSFYRHGYIGAHGPSAEC